MARAQLFQILETNSLQLMHMYSFLDLISNIEWSPDGHYILCGINKKGLVYIKSLDDDEWNCKIDEVD